MITNHPRSEVINGVPIVQHQLFSEVVELAARYIAAHEKQLETTYLQLREVRDDDVTMYYVVCHEYALCTHEILRALDVQSELRAMKSPEHVFAVANGETVLDAMPGLANPTIILAVHENWEQRLGINTLLMEQPLVNVCALNSELGELYSPAEPYEFLPPRHLPSFTVPIDRKEAVLTVMREDPPDIASLRERFQELG